MKQVLVYSGQTLIDIAIQELGDRERLFELAKLNNISITADLVPGTYLNVPDVAIDKKAIVKIFTEPSNKPASGIRTCNGELNTDGEGVGYWAIEDEFIVS